MGMGFEIWEQYRDEFPVTQNLVYLNHAAVSPLCRRAADAMRSLATDAEQWGSFHYPQWMACYDGLRAAAAKMINAAPGEIAIVKNTSEGIATIALGLDWRPGDKIVAFHGEFPANQYPWQKLASRGVTIEWLPPDAPLDQIDAAANGARLLAISYVQFLSGYRADLAALGEICHRRQVFFFVDAIQGLGAYPLDVRAMRIHALAADGHKWLTGPEGCGILYIQHDRQDQIEPVEFGWTNVASHADYARRDLTLRSDAGRYEPGTLNTIGCYGLRAAFEFLNEVGIERIAHAVTALTNEIAAGAAAKGYELLGPARTPASSAGIVCLRHPKEDPRLTHSRLRDAGFLTAPRAGWLRVSPHFYLSPEDIARFLAHL
jgi:cysteine desulfurase/selenocysteine lyase